MIAAQAGPPSHTARAGANLNVHFSNKAAATTPECVPAAAFLSQGRSLEGSWDHHAESVCVCVCVVLSLNRGVGEFRQALRADPLSAEAAIDVMLHYLDTFLEEEPSKT